MEVYLKMHIHISCSCICAKFYKALLHEYQNVALLSKATLSPSVSYSMCISFLLTQIWQMAGPWDADALINVLITSTMP